MRLISLLLALCAGFETNEQKAIKKIYGLAESTNEMRAKLLTVESDVKFNTHQLNKTRKYTELVHAAWKEALELKESLSILNETVGEQGEQIDAEEDARRATDRMLLDLFNSLLEIIDEKSFVMNNLRKDGSSTIEDAKEKLDQAKVVEELASTKKLLDKQGNQLKKQQARLIDFDLFESKLYDLESALKREESHRQELAALLSHDELVYKREKDDMLDTLNFKQTVDDDELNKRMQDMEQHFYKNFDLLKLNLTEVLVMLEEKDIAFDEMKSVITNMRHEYFQELEEYRWEIEQMSNMTQAIYYNGGDALDEVSMLVLNQTEQVENNTFIIDDMLNQMDYLTTAVHEIEDKVNNFTTASKKDKKDKNDAQTIKSLEEKVAALEYGVKIPPHTGEILVTGGDGEYGPRWETSLISTKYNASRSFKDMALPRSAHCMVKFRDEIFIIGGSWTAFGKLDSQTNEWVELDAMTESRDYGPGCGVFQDRIWVCGGHNGLNATETCESFAPENGWLPEAPLLTAVSSTSAAVNSAGLFIIGGADEVGETNIVQFYDQDAGVWTFWDELPVFGTRDAAAVTVNDDIYLIGGYNNENNILALDVPSQQWLNVTTLEQERVGAAAVAVDDEIWILGGTICFDEHICANRVEVYNTRDETLVEKRIKNHQNVNFASAILV